MGKLGIEKPKITRRETLRKNREIRHFLQGETASEAVGKLEPGCEIYGLTMGGFSLINLIEHCLGEIGAANITIATWTAADSDISKALEFLESGEISSLRFLVDASFYTRKPEYCQALIDKFGEGAIRASKSHCKFVLMGNDRWNLVIRTSANLNENKRTENFEISDDPAFYDFMSDVVQTYFDRPLDFSQGDRENDATSGLGIRRLSIG